MGQTIAGGVYKDAEGEGYHDANGKPVEKLSDKEHAKALSAAEAQSETERAAAEQERLARQRAKDAQEASDKAALEAKSAAAEAREAEKAKARAKK